MQKILRKTSAIRGSALLAGSLASLLFAACGGGGGSGSDMELLSVSVAGNGNWQLNRPIYFVFSDDVDFTTVNFNTIHIGQTNGGTALGEFDLSDSHTVKFQPRCPTLPDNSDAGLLPGGISYTVQVPGADSGASTVRSMSGGALGHTLTVQFNTVDSQDPADLFIDTAIGPPTPVIRTDPTVSDACYIEIGDDPANRVYFQPRPTPVPDLGADTPAGFTSGLNLYSDMTSHLAVLVAINQAVESSADNVNPGTVVLQYQSASGAWIGLAHTVVLEQNCLGTGALLRVTPTGILPQNHLVRVALTRDFKDLVGDSNLITLTVGTFLVETAMDPGTTTPGAASDELKEEFTVGGSSSGSLEDTESTLSDPRATWGQNGLLRAGFAFDGTGGPPDGTFDWKIGNDQPPSQTNHPQVILDTSFSVIINQQQTAQETVVNGRVDIRNLLVTASGTLVIQGPNPATILVAGSAEIDGEITLKGNSNLSVATLNTTNQPEPGASGKAGGGRGGTGNYLTSQSTPKGGDGFGAFDIANAGGVGGESAYNPSFPGDGDDAHRRPAGGGGGTFGHDFLRPAGIAPTLSYTNQNSCPDQFLVGYDAEQGFSGYNTAIGVITGAAPPRGGAAGPRPFFDSDPTNDFWGTMKTGSGQLIAGELHQPSAGAGGGAGGNAIVSNSFPTTPFDPGGDEKGSGGGGGGGSIKILALGNIVFGTRGRIVASGGTGGGGENSFGGDITHIGGGSGGGSGGHIILQTASQIDLRAVTTVPGALPPGGIYALGGNGGAGKNDLGGSHPNGVPAGPTQDALPPPNSYPNTTALCGVNGSSNTNNPGYPTGFANTSDPDGPALVVICAGGDGGPGIVQLHTPLLSDILVPTTSGENIYTAIKPPPIGSFPATGVPSYAGINNPLVWNQMLPIFGRRSQAISKWVPLGAASVTSDANSTVPGPVRFFFKGTTAAGVVQTTGSGAATVVAELSPILTGVITSPGFPYIDADLRTVVLDGSTIVDADDIYLRNVMLMKRFLLRLTHGAPSDFEVGSATYDPATHALRLTVTASGTPLAGFPVNSLVEVRPRFFRVLTDGVPNSLPDTSQIVAEFQATVPNAQGEPDENVIVMSPWVPDITLIDPNLSGNTDYKFFRFRISFDISANNAPLTFDTPIPSLDFFRIPIRF
jgi:hypothetical protein